MALVRVGISGLGLDRTNDTPVVILSEEDGERTLPIWIGPTEASAIATRLAELELPRPLTHDLLASTIRGFGGTLERAVVTHLRETLYVAELHVESEAGRIVLDARPSDAIAVALRLQAGIFVEEGLLSTAEPKLGELGTLEAPDDSTDPPDLLETERLRLRRLTSADAEIVFERWAQDPVVSRYLVWQPHDSVEESVAHAETCEAGWSDGSVFTWMIEEQATGVAVGSIAAHPSGPRVALGYLLARDSWGKGYMAEAVEALSDWFLALPHVYRVWAVCDTDNRASARVLQRTGFELEGTLRRWIDHPNISSEPRDVLCFARVSP